MKTLALACLLLTSSLAASQEATGPSIAISSVEFEAEVPSVPKLEARAVAIIRKRDPSLTLAQARELVRKDGVTDVDACKQVIVDYVLRGITQMQVTGVRVVRVQPPVDVPAQE